MTASEFAAQAPALMSRILGTQMPAIQEVADLVASLPSVSVAWKGLAVRA
ncbi:hypothetical protein [Streptosporangium sp. KLBMP 9127]|nr:hypothetical protein [Streptosporangium sp. KLBMP 9127]